MEQRTLKTTGDGAKYGTVYFFEAPKMTPEGKMYDFITGVFLGEGRSIGEGQNESKSFTIVDTSKDMVYIIPQHKVLQTEISKIQKAAKSQSIQNIFLSIKYEGKKVTSTDTSYHSYTVKWDEASAEEMSDATNVLKESKGE